MTPRRHQRSACPISLALDVFGDRWTLLVVRDLALKGIRSYSELQASEEGISTNILADRLARLEDLDIVTKETPADDKRRFVYRLTKRGADLLPVLVEIIVWSARHDPDTAVPKSFLSRAKSDRDGLIADLRKRLEC